MSRTASTTDSLLPGVLLAAMTVLFIAAWGQDSHRAPRSSQHLARRAMVAPPTPVLPAASPALVSFRAMQWAESTAESAAMTIEIPQPTPPEPVPSASSQVSSIALVVARAGLSSTELVAVTELPQGPHRNGPLWEQAQSFFKRLW